MAAQIITDLRALRRALEGGAQVEKILHLAGRAYPKVLYALSRKHHIPIQQVPEKALPPKATWAAYLSPIRTYAVEEALRFELKGLALALIGITDVRNVGGILRSAAAFGAEWVLWPTQRSAPLSDNALWLASAGALHHLRIVRSHKPYTDLRKLAERGWQLIAATKPSPSATPLLAHTWTTPGVLMLGSEDRGLPEAYLNLAPFHLTIPHVSTIESLNVSCAAAVLLWDYYARTRLAPEIPQNPNQPTRLP